jgi:hypothetical protein
MSTRKMTINLTNDSLYTFVVPPFLGTIVLLIVPAFWNIRDSTQFCFWHSNSNSDSTLQHIPTTSDITSDSTIKRQGTSKPWMLLTLISCRCIVWGTHRCAVFNLSQQVFQSHCGPRSSFSWVFWQIFTAELMYVLM